MINCPFRKSAVLIGLILSIGLSQLRAQQIGFDFPQGVKRVEIPFERYNNLLVIPVTLNNTFTLKFILDTGVQYAILTEKLIGQWLNLEYNRRLVIQGPGAQDSISALVASNISITLPGGVRSGINQSMLVLEKDYLDLKKNLGADVYGIIGYDIFSRFVVEINHDRNIIVLHEPQKFRGRGFRRKVPMKVVNTKPYISVNLTFEDGHSADMNLMVDTGASHAFLLHDDPNNAPFFPKKTVKAIIGRGLGGDINGHIGRIQHAKIDKFEFESPISSFPEPNDYDSPIKNSSRNGTIGGDMMIRFNLAFDYFRGYLYLNRSEEHKKKFEYDMGGIIFIANDLDVNSLRIVEVRENSPAFLAGIQVDDVITTVNGRPVNRQTFNSFIGLLKSKPGRKVSLKVLRNEEEIKASFKLERVI